jgi:hypothetical protein
MLALVRVQPRRSFPRDYRSAIHAPADPSEPLRGLPERGAARTSPASPSLLAVSDSAPPEGAPRALAAQRRPGLASCHGRPARSLLASTTVLLQPFPPSAVAGKVSPPRPHCSLAPSPESALPRAEHAAPLLSPPAGTRGSGLEEGSSAAACCAPRSCPPAAPTPPTPSSSAGPRWPRCTLAALDTLAGAASCPPPTALLPGPPTSPSDSRSLEGGLRRGGGSPPAPCCSQRHGESRLPDNRGGTAGEAGNDDPSESSGEAFWLSSTRAPRRTLMELRPFRTGLIHPSPTCASTATAHALKTQNLLSARMRKRLAKHKAKAFGRWCRR